MRLSGLGDLPLPFFATKDLGNPLRVGLRDGRTFTAL